MKVYYFIESVESALKNAEAVIVATEWREFLDFDISLLAKHLSGVHFVDAINAYDNSHRSK